MARPRRATPEGDADEERWAIEQNARELAEEKRIDLTISLRESEYLQAVETAQRRKLSSEAWIGQVVSTRLLNNALKWRVSEVIEGGK